MTDRPDDPVTLAAMLVGQAAAHAASEAVTELLRFSREGPDWPLPFGHVEVIEKLADALKLSLGLLPMLDDEQNRLLGAVSNYLDGRAG